MMDKADIIMTRESNPQALSVMYAKGFCSSPDYMTAREAAKVTSLKGAFNSNRTIENFDEMRFFTGLTKVVTSAAATQQMVQWATKLATITFPDNLPYIGLAAMGFSHNATPFRYILGSGVTSVNGGFGYGIGTGGLVIIIKATTPPAIVASSYYTSHAAITLYVPDSALAAYQADANWTDAVQTIDSISNCPASFLEYHGLVKGRMVI